MKLLNIKWKWTVPNVLSLLRIALLPAFAVFYLKSAGDSRWLWPAGGVLVLSGLTDLFDGWIARHFDQISDVGKLLDPLADKLTQLTVVACLATRYEEVLFLFLVCLAKEVAQAIGGLLLLHRGDNVRGSRWFGKVSTFVFYGSMVAIVLFRDMPSWGRLLLVILAGGTMLFAFFGYLKTYIGARQECGDTKAKI